MMGQERTRTTDISSGASAAFGTKHQLAQIWSMDVESDAFGSFLAKMPWDEEWDLTIPAERAFAELGWRRYPLLQKLPTLEASIPIPMTEVHAVRQFPAFICYLKFKGWRWKLQV